MKRSKAFTLIELLVVVAIIALLISILLPSLGRAREMAKRSACAANLRGVAQAIAIYGNSYRGAYPAATKARIRDTVGAIGPKPDRPIDVGQMANGALGTVIMFDHANPAIQSLTSYHRWQAIVKEASPAPSSTWILAPEKDESFALPTRDIFLVIKQQIAQPGQFVCPSTAHEKDPLWADKPGHGTPADVGASFVTDILAPAFLWDFLMPENLDYGYAMFHDADGAVGNDNLDPLYPVMADSNPYIRVYLEGNTVPTIKDTLRGDNSQNHGGDGQNVMYADTHASWTDRPTVGSGGDNIYTYSYSSPGVVTSSGSTTSVLLGEVPRGQASGAEVPKNWMFDLVVKTDAMLLP